MYIRRLFNELQYSACEILGSVAPLTLVANQYEWATSHQFEHHDTRTDYMRSFPCMSTERLRDQAIGKCQGRFTCMAAGHTLAPHNQQQQRIQLLCHSNINVSVNTTSKPRDHEKRKSFKTGDPANSGFSKTQLLIVSRYALALLSINTLEKVRESLFPLFQKTGPKASYARRVSTILFGGVMLQAAM